VLQVCAPKVDVQQGSPSPPQCTQSELDPQTALGPEHPPEPAVQHGLPSVPHVPPLQEPSAHMFEEPNVQLPPAETHLPFHGSQHPPLSHFAPGQHG
jgi:hypothetical protein